MLTELEQLPQSAPEGAVICALELVLLFHAASPWTTRKKLAWLNRITVIANASGIGLHTEATTRALCDAVRATLSLVKALSLAKQQP